MKVVLITGGARGIGAATANELQRRGWTTLLADLDGGDVILDVTDREACERVVAEVIERHGRLRAAITPPFNKTFPVERAARAIADGFDRRASRICTPKFVRAAHVMRAALRPFHRGLTAAVPDIERLFAEQMVERGRREASVSERVAGRLP